MLLYIDFFCFLYIIIIVIVKYYYSSHREVGVEDKEYGCHSYPPLPILSLQQTKTQNKLQKKIINMPEF